MKKIKRWLARWLKDELLETMVLTFVPECKVRLVENRAETKVLTDVNGCVIYAFPAPVNGYTIELKGYKVVKDES